MHISNFFKNSEEDATTSYASRVNQITFDDIYGGIEFLFEDSDCDDFDDIEDFYCDIGCTFSSSDSDSEEFFDSNGFYCNKSDNIVESSGHDIERGGIHHSDKVVHFYEKLVTEVRI